MNKAFAYFRCSSENPLQFNAVFPVVRNDDTRVFEDGRTHFGLIRYSFALISEHVADCEGLMQALLLQMKSPKWLFTWAFSPVVGRVRYKLIYGNRLREGWMVVDADDVAVAIIAWNPQSLRNTLPDKTLDVRDGGLAVIAGEPISVQELIGSAVFPSLRRFANAHRFTPTSDFIDWLSRHRLSFLYKRDTVVGDRTGIVLLTPDPIDLSLLDKQGVKVELYEEPYPGAVWEL